MNECPICGALVADEHAHLSWHAADEGYATVLAKAVRDLVGVVQRLNDRIEEAARVDDRG